MQKIIDTLYRQAERLITSDTFVSKLLDEVSLKVGELSESFYKIQDNVLVMSRMLSAWVKNDYKNISTGSIVSVVAALIYFVNPLDFIPDFIPVIGRLDDVLIIGYLVKRLNKEIERFMVWESEQQPV